ncbi:MAG TPA: NAD-dependent epimerase/dehydratase family protein [Candidatus Baltobacteraceae bacterium]|nr:NAD-dependent epimerase/dehydratase family protein [Candidatus Baltobacteraceae bacterium]
MDVLILGGTEFLGPHTVAALRARGHRATVFHRGRTPFAFGDDGVAEILGDRTSADVDALAARRWDAVIDTSTFQPDVVRRSTSALRDAASRYLFVSTVNVYADISTVGLTEDAPLRPPPSAETTDAVERYGAGKAACEAIVSEAFGERATIVRPGLIVGPYDPTDRFTYWAERLRRGGEILAPGRPERPVQFVDARDLADWFVRLLEDERGGAFHATGREMAMSAVLRAGLEAIAPASPAELIWIGEAELLASGVAPWTDLPLWLPETPELAGFLRIDIGRAVAAGLTLRDPRETFIAIASWLQSLPPDRERKAGLDPARERELLDTHHRANALAAEPDSR